MDAMSAYVDERTRKITSWHGEELAAITSLTHSRRVWTPNGGSYRMRYVRAVMPDGSRWHGHGSDGIDLINLHRAAA